MWQLVTNLVLHGINLDIKDLRSFNTNNPCHSQHPKAYNCSSVMPVKTLKLLSFYVFMFSPLILLSSSWIAHTSVLEYISCIPNFWVFHQFSSVEFTQELKAGSAIGWLESRLFCNFYGYASFKSKRKGIERSKALTGQQIQFRIVLFPSPKDSKKACRQPSMTKCSYTVVASSAESCEHSSRMTF